MIAATIVGVPVLQADISDLIKTRVEASKLRAVTPFAETVIDVWEERLVNSEIEQTEVGVTFTWKSEIVGSENESVEVETIKLIIKWALAEA